MVRHIRPRFSTLKTHFLTTNRISGLHFIKNNKNPPYHHPSSATTNKLLQLTHSERGSYQTTDANKGPNQWNSFTSYYLLLLQFPYHSFCSKIMTRYTNFPVFVYNCNWSIFPARLELINKKRNQTYPFSVLSEQFQIQVVRNQLQSGSALTQRGIVKVSCTWTNSFPQQLRNY